MSTATATAIEYNQAEDLDRAEYVTIRIGDQLLGIPILTVQDVLGPHKILRIPLAPKAVAGALNLRGRIVTALDARIFLNMPPCEDPSAAMSVVINHKGKLYSLLVDDVGDVLAPSTKALERIPSNIPALWRDVCSGVYRLADELLLVLEVDRLFRLMDEDAR